MNHSSANQNKIKYFAPFLGIYFFIGVLAALVAWCFLFCMEHGIALIWEHGAAKFNSPFYPLIVCGCGGALIGLCQRRFGVYPRPLSDVMKSLKSQKGYGNHPFWGILLCSLLPLFFGGSIGPEAGLTSIIAVLCSKWSSNLRYAGHELKNGAEASVAAVLSVIFKSPLFGLAAPLEDEKQTFLLPGKQRFLFYLMSVAGGFATYLLLSVFLGNNITLGRFSDSIVASNELLWFFPLCFLGIAMGIFYQKMEQLSQKAFHPLENKPVLKGIIGGLVLAGAYTILPLTLFSGEVEMNVLMDSWQQMPVIILFLTAIVKVILTSVCIASGWRGGHIFPVIFSGICGGYAMAALMKLDGTFSAAVVASAFTTTVLNSPLITVCVLVLCFPLHGIVAVICSAAFASLPKKALLKRSHKVN